MNGAVNFEVRLRATGADIFKKISAFATEARERLRNFNGEVSDSSRRLREMAERTLMLDACTRAVRDLNDVVSQMAAPYNSFEDAMRKANTMAGKNAEGYKALKNEIRNLSKEIPVAREQLAEGLYQTISNGVPEADQTEFLRQSAKASVGGVADLGQTVTVTSTIIKNYGLAWASAGAVQDKIQLTAKNGVTSFEQLAQALPRVTGSASQLGVEINELMATFATTTGVTGNTSEVSTQLAAVLNSLIKPTSEATAAADAMGIRFDAASIKACGGFQHFLNELDVSVKAYAAESGQLSQTIYGQLFGSAEALRLIGSLTGEQKDKFVENIAAMNDSAGTVDVAYEEVVSTATSAETIFKNKMQAFADWGASVAATSGPVVALVANPTTTAMSVKQVAGVFGTFTSAVKGWQLSALAAVAVEKTIIGVTKMWQVAQIALNAVLSANPISLIIIAVAALVAGIIYAYNNCEEFRNICDKLWAVIKELASVVWDFLVKAFEKASKVIKTAWEWVKKFFGIDGEESASANADALDRQVASTENLTDATKDGTAAGLKAAEAANWQTMSYDQLGKAIERQKTKLAQLSDANSAAAQKDRALLKQMESRYAQLGKGLGLSAATEINLKPAKGSEAAFEKEKQKLEEKLKSINPEIDPESYRQIIEQIRNIDNELSAIDNRKLRINMELQFPDFKPLQAKDIIPEKIDLTKGLFENVNPKSIIKQLSDSIHKGVDGINASLNSSNLDGFLSTAGKGLQSVSQMFRSVAKMTGESTAELLNWGAQLLATVSAAIPAIQAVTCAKAAESAAATPVIGWLQVGAAVAAVLATFAAIPKFADGGIAYGPTLGIFGEYAGAVNNPEVVAPLDKLQGLLAPAVSPMGGKVRFVIERGRLVGIINLADELNRRR